MTELSQNHCSIISLVELCLHGNQAAMLQLVERSQGLVFRLCLRMLGHQQDVEDIAQETLIRMFRSLHCWDQERRFEPWLLAIASNRCRTLLAQRARRPNWQLLDDSLPETSLAENSADLLAEEIGCALQIIPANLREAFVLFHEHEMSYAEIAEILNRPLGTIKTWIHRARRQLVQRLQNRQVLEKSTYALQTV